MRMYTEYQFESKKKYLSKRIREEYDFLKKCSIRNYNLQHIISLCSESFFYSAPEVVDWCFDFLRNYIHLDEDFECKYKNGVNIYGDPIRCFHCHSFDHILKDCDKIVTELPN